MVPAEVISALDGRPDVGEWAVMFPLVTVDDAGFPHVCLLSRSELAADRWNVYAAVAGPTTIDNLRRDGRATLSVVTFDLAFHLKLQVVEAAIEDDLLVAVLRPVAIKRDDAEVPLLPPRYYTTPELAAGEKWDLTAQLLKNIEEGNGLCRR